MKKTATKAVVAAVLVVGSAFGLGRGGAPRVQESLRPFEGGVTEIAATQAFRYRFAQEVTTLYPRAHVRSVFEPHDGGYSIRPEGRETYSQPYPLKEAQDKLYWRVSRSEGVEWFLRAADGFERSVVRFDANPAMYMDTAGTLPIDIVVGTVVNRFPEVQSLGIFVCKRISGSTSYSQHSWANGVDFGSPYGWGSDKSIAFLDRVNGYVQLLWNEEWLPVSQLGWRNWPNHYPGHIHVSGDPLKTGTPPCA